MLDLTRSVAGSQVVVTSLDASWQAASPGTRIGAETSITGAAGAAAWSAVAALLTLPGWAIFGTLAALLLWLGRKRRSAYSRFARE